MHNGELRTFAFAVALLIAVPMVLRAQDRTRIGSVDEIFSKWSGRGTPGCVVGISDGGNPTVVRTYGMADLEHDVPNGPDTIFEAGSVSKQFTAAAVLLLEHDGKLSLEDQVRKYIPELPDYGTPLTIRHLLMHTSGLREWGALVDIAGSPRWMRNAYTQDDVLLIASRQRTLNFAPGTRWSYSNTGYNLAAIIVSRVSGTTFAEFARTRIFEPLQMAHTSWDVDHTRIVKGRATAYSEQSDGFHTFMPFEDVYGNRGLLTTVSDLLTWNRNFESPIVGDRAFVAEEQQPGRFADGRQHTYAFGLYVGTYKGVREVGHEGGTAGYRSDLIRFPDQQLSVAVLCNASPATATAYAHAVADLYLHSGPQSQSAPDTGRLTLTAADLDRVVGVYRNVTGRAVTVEGDNTNLRLEYDGFPIPLVPISPVRFSMSGGTTLTLESAGHAVTADPDGIFIEHWVRVPAAKPSPAELRQLVGTYSSDETHSTIVVAPGGRSLVLARPSAPDVTLTPAYVDAFAAGQLGTIIFRRNKNGRIQALSVVQDGPYDGVWDLRFTRVR